MLHYKQYNEFILIDLMDLPCFGVSVVLVGSYVTLMLDHRHIL